jgi:membrane fusion protein (multidrug efflux system)
MNSSGSSGSGSSNGRGGYRVPAGISGVVIFALGGGGFLLHRAESGVNKVALADEPKGVTVVEAHASTFRESHRYIGTLEAWLQARVGPQLASGYVDTVLVRPGALVKRGEVLATLDCRNASSANQAVTLQARALEQRQKAAAREASRLGELLDGGYVSPNEVEQKQASAASNEASMQALLAQAAGKTLEVNDCVLRAPFDGEVAVRLADPGSFVRPGSAIVQLVDRTVVRLSGDVPEIDFDAVAPKTPIKVKLLSNGQEINGEVARRAPAADPSTRTVHFEVDIPNADRTIPVNTTAEIHVDVGQPMAATEIPLLAAKIRGKSASVFVIGSDSVAKKQTLAVLGERGGSLFVKSETLKPGTQVVTQGRALLGNNDRVVAKLDSPNSNNTAPRSGTAPPNTRADEEAPKPPKPATATQ